MADTNTLTQAIRVLWPDLPVLVGDSWPQFEADLTTCLTRLESDEDSESVIHAMILNLFAENPEAHQRLVKLMAELDGERALTMRVLEPVYSLKDFTSLTEHGDLYPFYGVLLYAPTNGLDARLHEYVTSHWSLMNALTGNSCLLLAVENPWERPIEGFKPEEVYDIARHLGAGVGELPCLIYFTQPGTRRETLVLKLGEFLSGPDRLTDEELTDFFRSVQSILDSCSEKRADFRLKCLSEGLEKEWPRDSRWADVASKAGGWLVMSAPVGATILQAMNAVKGLLGLG